MADKTSWTKPLDSVRGRLGIVRCARVRATVWKLRGAPTWWRRQCTDERSVLKSEGFDYDVGDAVGQCSR